MCKEEKGRCGAPHDIKGPLPVPTEGAEGTLFIQTRRARYRPATPDQIVQAARRVVDQRVRRGAAFDNPAVAREYFRDKLGGLQREVFAVAMLDTRHRLIEFVELFQGTVDGAEVHPRELVRQALQHNAAAVIVGHNHPSGDLEPSAADRAVTTRIKQALVLVDVRLLDHVIVGGNRTLALSERGWV